MRNAARSAGISRIKRRILNTGSAARSVFHWSTGVDANFEMDLIYMPEVLSYGSLRHPQYRDYEQPWNKDYFNYGKPTTRVNYQQRTQQQHDRVGPKSTCSLCKENKRRSLAAYIRGKARKSSCSEIHEEPEEEEEEEEVEETAEEDVEVSETTTEVENEERRKNNHGTGNRGDSEPRGGTIGKSN